ncbi:MAG: NUMOD4 motif-containing HNH endonuclease [Clostridiales bacterium]|nr:NUMOD4 motif-containing HNH endonuclease [Clostridiales bacterium]
MTQKLTNKAKCELLKDSITYLYEKEGRSKSYISRVLMLDRTTLARCINDEWGLVKADERHLTPSNQKFLNNHRKDIVDMLDTDITMSDIARKLKISRKSLLDTFIRQDKELLHHYNLYKQRAANRSEQCKQEKMDKSRLDYDFEPIEGEEWQPILGYEQYEVSNMGRVRHYAQRYKKYYLLKLHINNFHGRAQIILHDAEGKQHTLNFARIVAHTFVGGFDENHNTVDHLDGNPLNNRADNLEWVSQSENNLRSFQNGKKGHAGYSKNKKFRCVILDGKYEFKTFVALAKFLGVSETQLGRYIDGVTKTTHTFEFKY